jgi:alanyl-tRNA synthetase
MRSTPELREGFLRYFESRGHKRLPSAPLIPPPEDTSTLLISAGMQPLKPYFLGQKEAPATLLTTYQKCFRATDIDEVGLDGYHLSFFEMMGNFSIGEYFKEGAVELAWEFLTEHLKIDLDRLWVSVFAGDPELGLGEDEVAIAAWEKVGQPRDRIVGLPRSENFWQAGDTGPCGPCSEMYYDRGEELCGEPDCAPGHACERFLEFWNLVFMEFDLGADGKLTPLPKPVIDTGLGLERTAAIQQGVISVYETDGYQGIMDWIEDESGVAWQSSEKATKAHRIIADHGRGMTFLVADGVLPSNDGRGYVLRRVIRRAVQQARGIGLTDLWRIADVVADQMSQWYPELEENRDRIKEILRAEEERFSQTLERGLGLFEEIAAGDFIAGEDAFKLHDTYGFPLELTRELAAERGLAVDEEEFSRLMAEQRARSKTKTAAEVAIAVDGSRPTDFVGYETTEALTAILAYEDLGDGTFQAKLERSPFYPEGGGQVSDFGYIENEETGARADLIRATRVGDDQVLTFEGKGFAGGDRVRAVVPWSVRFPTMANHTATHLLHQALRNLLGDQVRQAGSAVRPDKLRFDFTYDKALTPEEREQIEQAVNEKVFQNLPVRTFVTPIEEARKLGAMMLFGEKYGHEVRVVEIDDYSRELCGGTHVRSTAEIGPFVILSEGSVGSGARRIEAITAGEAWAWLRARAEEVEVLRAEAQQLRKGAGRKQAASEQEVTYRDESNGIVVAEVEALKGADLKDLSDRIRQSKQASAVLLGSVDEGRAYLVVNLDRSLVEQGLDAVAVARKAAEKIGGGGGGRPDLAEAGGKNPEGLAEAYEVAKSEIASALK